MTNYPRPPVGFQFTEENVKKAIPFYALWLLQTGIEDRHFLLDRKYYFVTIADFIELTDDYVIHSSLPWTVPPANSLQIPCKHYTFTETPLPEGEI
jgi:hypothetical protein